jgi:hypothetical protein
MTDKVGFDQGDLKGLYLAIDGLQAKNLVQPELEGLATRIIDVTCVYPPPVPGYDRTGNLGRSWAHEIGPLQLTVTNTAGYAPFVQGAEQRGYHKAHGWLNVFDVAENLLDKFVQDLGDRACRIWAR